MADVKVTGLKELGDTLRRLPKELASKNGGPIRQALFQALKPIRDDARSRAPEHDGAPLKKGKQPAGTLKKNIVAQREKRPDKYGLTELYHVRVRSGRSQKTGDAYYWRWVEFGHLIVPRFRTKKQLTMSRKGDLKFKRRRTGIAAARRAARARGRMVAPKPFMRPAFEANKAAALAIFQVSLVRNIARAVRKARAGR